MTHCKHWFRFSLILYMSILNAHAAPNTQISADTQQPKQLIQWAAQKIVPILSFSFQDNPKTYWQPYRKFFSSTGWTHFKQALQQSGNIQTIISHDLTTHIQLGETGEARPGVRDNQQQTWHVSIPAKIIYAGNTLAVTQPIMVHLTLKYAQQHEILIDQIIAQNSGAFMRKTIKPRGCALRKIT